MRGEIVGRAGFGVCVGRRFGVDRLLQGLGEAGDRAREGFDGGLSVNMSVLLQRAIVC